MSKTTKQIEPVDTEKADTKKKLHTLEGAVLVDGYKLSGGKTSHLKVVVGDETFILLATKIEEK